MVVRPGVEGFAQIAEAEPQDEPQDKAGGGGAPWLEGAAAWSRRPPGRPARECARSVVAVEDMEAVQGIGEERVVLGLLLDRRREPFESGGDGPPIAPAILGQILLLGVGRESHRIGVGKLGRPLRVGGVDGHRDAVVYRARGVGVGGGDGGGDGIVGHGAGAADLSAHALADLGPGDERHGALHLEFLGGRVGVSLAQRVLDVQLGHIE